MENLRTLFPVVEDAICETIEKSRKPIFTEHAKKRMEERSISEIDIYNALVQGRVREGFGPDQYPRGETPFQNRDMVFTVRWATGAKDLTVAIALVRAHHTVRVKIITCFQD